MDAVLPLRRLHGVGLACPLAAARIQKTKINILDEDRQGRYIYNCAYEVMFLTADVVLDYHQSESYIMSTTLLDKLKPEFHTNPPAEENGILLCLDEA